MTTYQEKLKDPRWQKKRLEILERDNWACQSCADTESTLFVHHKRHIKGTEPWDHPNEYFITLCEECHNNEREERSRYENSLLEILREKFLSGNLFSIMHGFYELKLTQHEDIISSVLEWFLENQKIQKEMVDRYFDYLHKNKKKMRVTLKRMKFIKKYNRVP